MKHTPGPWKSDLRKSPSCSYLIGSGGEIVLEITPECLPSKSDARLLAAAPEMLDKLKVALRRLIEKSDDSNRDLGLINSLKNTINRIEENL